MSRARSLRSDRACRVESSSRSKALRSCGSIAVSSGSATWHEDREGSPRRCRSIIRSTGSIFIANGRYGSYAMTHGSGDIGQSIRNKRPPPPALAAIQHFSVTRRLGSVIAKLTNEAQDDPRHSLRQRTSGGVCATSRARSEGDAPTILN